VRRPGRAEAARRRHLRSPRLPGLRRDPLPQPQGRGRRGLQLAGPGALCRRAIEPRSGFWTIPAGYLEIGESTEAGAKREAFEEARARIEIEGLLAVYNVVRIAQVQLLYRARLLSPQVEAGPETEELDLFTWHGIPWDELAFPTVHWVLRRARDLRHHEGPYPPVFGP
jgi:ADP-ribose pyrophosphatase YjhB (NUDIX family)